jgi:uncharacterized membrane protein
METLLLALLIGAVVWFFPMILAFVVITGSVLFCLLMAGLCWIKETFTPKKPNR